MSDTGRIGVSADVQDVLNRARQDCVEFVHLQFTDIPGTIKGVSIPAERLEACFLDGVWFDGSSVEGLARLAESDLYLVPDPTTFAILPWERVRTARLICDLQTPERQPFVADPRQVLKRALARASERGYDYRVGAEVEFYLFEEEALRPGGGARALIAPDARSYFELPVARAAAVCHEAVKVLRGFGYRVSASHHEVSPGQYEIDLDEDDALRTADAIVAFKLAVRTLATQQQLFPTFMPKPKPTASGSGLHLGQILARSGTDENLFFDPAATGHLSTDGQAFIAGQLAHARGACALLAPLVNSYKRLLGGSEAPSRVTWATISRGSFIRVPETRSAASETIEVRAADPSCNPYLALAVLLQAGLDGIDQGLALPPPDPGSLGEADLEEGAVDLLPSTLGEALEELGWDMVVRDALGQSVFERFLAAKEAEWSAYRHHVSDWELETYLETA